MHTAESDDYESGITDADKDNDRQRPLIAEIKRGAAYEPRGFVTTHANE